MTEIIVVPVEEYRSLLKTNAMVEAFRVCVLNHKFDIDRDVCAAYFGFELPEVKNGAIHD